MAEPKIDLTALRIDVHIHENRRDALLTIVGKDKPLTVSIPVEALEKLRDHISERLDLATRLRPV
jgi:hypothetical protein